MLLTHMRFDVNGDWKIGPGELGPDTMLPKMAKDDVLNLKGPFPGKWKVAEVHVGTENGKWTQTLFLRKAA